MRHYDHLGEGFGRTYWGADDNASGVAVVLETARRLTARKGELGREILVCLFDCEEPPFFLSPDMGSQFFVDHPPVPIGSIDLMICLDIVGHSLGPPSAPPEVADSIFALGAELNLDIAQLIDATPVVNGIFVRRLSEYLVPDNSDYVAFKDASVPFVFYSCGRSAHYHQPTDTPDRLDFPKMMALAKHLETVIVGASSRPSGSPNYVADDAGDQATIATLRAIITPFAGALPEVAVLEALLDAVESGLDGSRISEKDLGTLQMIVAQVESALV